jgi:hypothetical protein
MPASPSSTAASTAPSPMAPPPPRSATTPSTRPSAPPAPKPAMPRASPSPQILGLKPSNPGKPSNPSCCGTRAVEGHDRCARRLLGCAVVTARLPRPYAVTPEPSPRSPAPPGSRSSTCGSTRRRGRAGRRTVRHRRTGRSPSCSLRSVAVAAECASRDRRRVAVPCGPRPQRRPPATRPESPAARLLLRSTTRQPMMTIGDGLRPAPVSSTRRGGWRCGAPATRQADLNGT